MGGADLPACKGVIRTAHSELNICDGSQGSVSMCQEYPDQVKPRWRTPLQVPSGFWTLLESSLHMIDRKGRQKENTKDVRTVKHLNTMNQRIVDTVLGDPNKNQKCWKHSAGQTASGGRNMFQEKDPSSERGKGWRGQREWLWSGGNWNSDFIKIWQLEQYDPETNQNNQKHVIFVILFLFVEACCVQLGHRISIYSNYISKVLYVPQKWFGSILSMYNATEIQVPQLLNGVWEPKLITCFLGRKPSLEKRITSYFCTQVIFWRETHTYFIDFLEQEHLIRFIGTLCLYEKVGMVKY